MTTMHVFAHLNCVNKIVSLLKTNKNILPMNIGTETGTSLVFLGVLPTHPCP